LAISIHQPNYLPWAKLIHKIASSNIYVVFDDVQLPRGKSFVLRTRIKTQSGEKWLTIPVKNKSSKLSINKILVNDEINWREKHWNSIKNNYQKAPYFHELKTEFEKIIFHEERNLSKFNIHIIMKILGFLKIKTRIEKSSNLKIKSNGTEKIVTILNKLNADIFLSGTGTGSKRYIVGQEKQFENEKIKIKYHKFKLQKYEQILGPFIPNLSVCDMLFNIGIEKTKQELNPN
jgi:hypothetical protein